MKSPARVQKTSIGLPWAIWEAAKVRAIRERRTLADIASEAIANYLKVPRRAERA